MVCGWIREGGSATGAASGSGGVWREPWAVLCGASVQVRRGASPAGDGVSTTLLSRGTARRSTLVQTPCWKVYGSHYSTKSEKRIGNKTNLITTGEQELQREMSNPIKLHKRSSLKSQGMLRVTDDLLAISKQPPSDVPENRTHMHMTIPHLPKINPAVIQENNVKESQVPISLIADYFTERKKALKLNGFHWQRENVSVPSNLPLVIRSYKTGNSDNITRKEKCAGNRKGRTSCFLETSTGKILQNSVGETKRTASDSTGLGNEVENSSSLRPWNESLTTKFQKARTKVAARFQGGHGFAVDGGNIISVKSVKGAKIANSSSDSVARMKWTKGFVQKAVNRQQRPSATSFAEKGNTRLLASLKDTVINRTSIQRNHLLSGSHDLKSWGLQTGDLKVKTELEQDCRPSGLNEITLDLALEHRSVNQAANCCAPTGSDKLYFDDIRAHNVEDVTGLKGVAEAILKTTFQSPDFHKIFPVTPNCEKSEGKMNKIMKQPGRKHQQTKSSSSVVTCVRKSSVRLYSSKTSEKTACCSAFSKCSDKESKVSSGMSEDGRNEEYTFDLNQILQERGTSTSATIGVPLVKCGARHYNQKQPLKSSLKKSFDWRAHSQTMTVHLPKNGDQRKDACVNWTLDRSMKGCLQNKLIPLSRSLNQTAQDYVCSIPEESTEFCAEFCYDQKQYGKLSRLCHQPSRLGSQTAIQQRLEQLRCYGTTEQGFVRNMEMAANTKMHSNQFYRRENHTFQPEDEPQHLQFPQPRVLIRSKNLSAERTVELFGSHGGEVPKITMTCPTPVPPRPPS